MNYLLPSLIFGYGFINANLALDFSDWYRAREKETAFAKNELVEIFTNDASFITSQLDTGDGSDLRHALSATSAHSKNENVVDKLTDYLTTLSVSDEEGMTQLPVQLIHFVEVKGKSYVAYTADGMFQIRKTIAELETELNPESFYRLNRSVIVNLRCVKNFSYWEYEKYVVRLTNNKSEFIMQRNRLKEFKERLNTIR